MKTLMMAVLLCAITGGSALAAESSPSKKETANFIKTKIEDRTQGETKISFDDEYCRIHVKTNYGPYELDRMAHISQLNIEYVYYGSDYVIDLKCISGSCITIAENRFDGRSGEPPKNTKDVHLTRSTDTMFLDKISKALNHLRGKCIGKADLF